MSAIWITGAGSLTAGGLGLDVVAADLAAARVRAGEVDRSAGCHRPDGARTAVLAGHVSTRELIPPMVARRMSPGSRFAVAAARGAAAEAGLGREALAGAAVVLANAYGAATVTEGILRQIFTESPEAASPALFTESVANAPAAQVALQLGARGPNLTITQRQAGPLLALHQAATLLRAGRTAVALVGAVDEVSPLLHAVLDRFGALATAAPGEPELARAFDRRRAGCLAGEGAAMLVLETAEHAAARDARPLAILGPCGAAFDPAAPRTGWSEDPTPLAATLSSFMEQLASPPDAIVTGGCGLWGSDRLEGQVLGAAVDRLPPVLAPKAVLGEQGTALLTTAVTALGESVAIGPLPGCDEPDPALPVTPWPGGVLPPVRRVLLTAFAAGGAAAWAILERA